ncbi:o-succinylbenzoate synthase [Enterococcus caccae]|uniref:o-succinylbenzoate synthase n=1 Tax=Enterococcus caccae ATCC BAA-1240 TaxID=1158612 RepID=R3U9G8_9ENTE|nr:o-succinylbenzoate synthase [Enterococcus caccae]EOL50624.1 O-succinylbenzoate synthase [Enterococcus caccae ATCC BAA-1240]EOT59483.1 O-succinylbenzoate synthase [Enterococcus caccae ATCC BAA-1240]
MKIHRIDRYRVRLPLRIPFETSYGRLTEKAFDILVLTDELGNQGMGELVPFEQPDYIEETIDTARVIIEKHLIPLLKNTNIQHPEEVSALFDEVKGNQMAKSSLETAIWDLFAKRNRKSLKTYFYDTRVQIPVGISVGIQTDLTKLLNQITQYIALGYQRIKLKIRPGYDLEPIDVIRNKFPDIPLMVDANSAYTITDIPHLVQLDAYNLAMIEQPFAANDFLDHAQLQKELKTDICLDENIRTLKDCELAFSLGSCRSINLKIPRVGGITEAMKIVDFCKERELLVWLGGMFESGVGRALNLQFASQKIFTFPGDISASDRYYHEDIITEPFEIQNGEIIVPDGVGIGVSLAQEKLLKYGAFDTLWIK